MSFKNTFNFISKKILYFAIPQFKNCDVLTLFKLSLSNACFVIKALVSTELKMKFFFLSGEIIIDKYADLFIQSIIDKAVTPINFFVSLQTISKNNPVFLFELSIFVKVSL